MRNEFTAIVERDVERSTAYRPETPEANGRGKLKDRARGDLAEAILTAARWGSGKSRSDLPAGWNPDGGVKR